MRRMPLWAALLPLAAGLAAYWLYWRAEANAFRAAVQRTAPGAMIGGFPYRIEARLPGVDLQSAHGGGIVSLRAGQTAVNRQPWRAGHVVIAAERPRLDVMLSEIAGARLAVEAPAALASLRRRQGITERLSIRFETATVWLPLAGGPFSARGFELHVRETPTKAAGGRSPTPPAQAEARISGELERAGGAAFTVDVPLFATAAQRIDSVAGWRRGGTIEIKDGRLLATGGEAVAGFDATLAPLSDGRIAIAGTVDTDCPETLRALLAGRAAAREFRSRRTQRLPITGIGGALSLGAPAGPTGGPVRSQEPPCPVLRR